MATTAQFKAWRFGYEYDFLYRERGFLGVLFDVKYTDVNVGLNSPIGDEFTKAVAPLPTIGGVARVYAARNLALNAEVSYVKVPESALGQTIDGRYVDFDINATYNPHKNVGVQAGYRSIDLIYAVEPRFRLADLQGPVLRRHRPLLALRRGGARSGAGVSGQVTNTPSHRTSALPPRSAGRKPELLLIDRVTGARPSAGSATSMAASAASDTVWVQAPALRRISFGTGPAPRRSTADRFSSVCTTNEARRSPLIQIAPGSKYALSSRA